MFFFFCGLLFFFLEHFCLGLWPGLTFCYCFNISLLLFFTFVFLCFGPYPLVGVLGRSLYFAVDSNDCLLNLSHYFAEILEVLF